MHSSFVISLDFELGWGVRDQPMFKGYREHIEGVPRAVDGMLSLFERHQTHATWACVGLMMCDDADDALANAPDPRPTDLDPDLDPYPTLSTRAQRPEECGLWFAPQLVRRVATSPNQELATHTFSHLCCGEPSPGSGTLAADLEAAFRCHSRFDSTPRAIVFPRNMFSRPVTDVCREAGLSCFRGNPESPLWPKDMLARTSLPVRAGRLVDAHIPLVRNASVPMEAALHDVPASRFLRPAGARRALTQLRVRRIKGEMSRVAEQGGCYHLWWHPHNFGVRTEENLEMLEAILAHRAELERRKGMQSRTMSEQAELSSASSS